MCGNNFVIYYRGKSDLAYFGRTVCCSSENELMAWLAGLLIAQVCIGRNTTIFTVQILTNKLELKV